MRPALFAVLAALLVGCGGSKSSTPSTAAESGRKAVDVRWVVRESGETESAFAPPADDAVQRVTLRNATPYQAELTGSSRSGQGSATVPAGKTVSISWPRKAGPDKVVSRVRYRGHSDLDSASTYPVD